MRLPKPSTKHPAPSDDTVYYLTVSIDLDWGELPDADVK